MEHVARQLEQIRRTARRMLVLQRLAQWSSVMGLLILAGALIDYLLRLPGWLRLLFLVVTTVIALGWLFDRLSKALRFAPRLNILALRAEKLFPQLAGILATGVDLTENYRAYAQVPQSAAMADQSISLAEQQLQGLSLNRLIDPARTLRWLALWLAIFIIVAGTAIAAGGNTGLAVRRWLAPLGDATWPRRTQIVDLVDRTAWPSDTPVLLKAQVTKNYSRSMRTWADYRLVDQAGKASPWRSVLMSDQSFASSVASPDTDDKNQRGVFERLIDANTAGSTSEIIYRFRAGDDQTKPRKITLIDRPTVEKAVVTITPPAYAAQLVEPQQVILSDQAGQLASASGLRGSEVSIQFSLNKMIDKDSRRPLQVIPGFADEKNLDFSIRAISQDDMNSPVIMTVAFILDQSTSTNVLLVDEHDLTNLSEKIYRIDAIEDRPPAVSVTEPVTDEAVLATAVINTQAMAQDDVGVQSLAIEAAITPAGLEKQSAEQLTAVHEQNPRLSVNHQVDLSDYKLQTNDILELTAVASDVYNLDDQTHDPVRSTPRKLHIIDSATLVAQIRNELAGLRQQAVRLEAGQQTLTETPAAKAQPAQQEITRRIQTQTRLVDALNQRIDRNRLDQPSLSKLLEQVDTLLNSAADQSSQAADQLARAAQNNNPNTLDDAREKQNEAAKNLRDLASLLDQGKDIVGLQLKLKELLTKQLGLAADTRQLMPETLGRDLDQLTDQQQSNLDQLQARQRQLAEQSQSLTGNMQNTAQSLERQSTRSEDKAAAEALSKAAAISQRRGLSSTMQQAASATAENKLSQAGDQQGQSIDILEQMLKELDEIEKRQREVLKRQLTQLADAIQRLITQQNEQLQLLQEANVIIPLAAPMEALRRTTMTVADKARQPQTQQVADLIDQASANQGHGIEHLRTMKKSAALVSETAALKNLEDALALIKQMQQQLDDQQASQEREKLRKKYLQLAKQESQLRNDTLPLTNLDNPTRRDRASLIDLGHRQAAIRSEALDLSQQVEKTLIFKHLHQRIDQTAAGTIESLRAAAADQNTLRDQQSIENMLLTMATALKQDDPSQNFARESGSGGQGSSSGGQPPLVPPLAELKALKIMQIGLYEQTRNLDQAPGDNEPQVIELSVQQRELSQLGERLIETMQNQLAQQQQMNDLLQQPNDDQQDPQ